MMRLLIAITPLLAAAALPACGRLNARHDGPETFEAFSKTYAASSAGDCDDRCLSLRKEFAYAVYVGKQIYQYWDLKRAETGLDYDALARQLEERIVTGTSQSQYYTVLQTYAASLHDGHVNAIPPTDLSAFEFYTAPVRLELLAAGTDHERLIVAEVKEANALQVGDVVTAVNGKPAADAIAEVAAFTSGSTERMRRAFGAKKLTDVIGLDKGQVPLTITYKRGDAAEATVALPRTVTLNTTPDPNAPAAPAATGAELVKASILAGNIGYLRIDGFTGSQDSALQDHALNALQNTKALIIDVRLNGGGDLSGDTLIARFIDHPVTRYSISQRMSDYTLSQRPEYFQEPWTVGADYADWHDLTVQPSAPAKHYGKKVILLTSPRCFSACDTFSAGLKANHLATVVGEATGGGTGTPLVFELPISGFTFRYGVVRGRTAEGTWIEGAGTTPDVVVETSVEDRLQKKDPQLAKALELIDQEAVEAGVAQVAAQNGSIQQQGFDAAPTVLDIRALQALSARDGLD
jgi:C-terminal processing protease CtpA/Prc